MAQHVSIDSSLATYLLSLVGHVIERHKQSQEQKVLLASKAVAVYKLVAQVMVIACLVHIHPPSPPFPPLPPPSPLSPCHTPSATLHCG